MLPRGPCLADAVTVLSVCGACAVLPGVAPGRRSSEAQRRQHVSLEVTPVQTQREPVPRPGPGFPQETERVCGRDRGRPRWQLGWAQ